MKDINTAKSEQYSNSTREEMFDYCRRLGIKVGPASKTDTLRRLLCEASGIVPNESPAVSAVVRPMRVAEPIVPLENLTPNGVFGGRKWRVRVGRPPDSPPKEVGTILSWNGKQCAIRWNEVNVIPEPIYLQMRDAEQKVVKSVVNEDKTEQTTVFEYEPKYPMSDARVEAGTEHLCGGLQEWYQKKGPAWIKARSVRELQTICRLLDLPTHTKNERNQKLEPLPQDELVASLLLYCYGHADVIESEESVA